MSKQQKFTMSVNGGEAVSIKAASMHQAVVKAITPSKSSKFVVRPIGDNTYEVKQLIREIKFRETWGKVTIIPVYETRGIVEVINQ